MANSAGTGAGRVWAPVCQMPRDTLERWAVRAAQIFLAAAVFSPQPGPAAINIAAATASPNPVLVGSPVLLSVTVTSTAGSITSVVVNAGAIGGPSALPLNK